MYYLGPRVFLCGSPLLLPAGQFWFKMPAGFLKHWCRDFHFVFVFLFVFVLVFVFLLVGSLCVVSLVAWSILIKNARTLPQTLMQGMIAIGNKIWGLVGLQKKVTRGKCISRQKSKQGYTRYVYILGHWHIRQVEEWGSWWCTKRTTTTTGWNTAVWVQVWYHVNRR